MQKATGYHLGPVVPPTAEGASLNEISSVCLDPTDALQMHFSNHTQGYEQLRIIAWMNQDALIKTTVKLVSNSFGSEPPES